MANPFCVVVLDAGYWQADRRSGEWKSYASCGSAVARAGRSAHPGGRRARSTPGSGHPSATAPQRPPHAQRHRSLPPQPAPPQDARHNPAKTPQPTGRLQKHAYLQVFPSVGETGVGARSYGRFRRAWAVSWAAPTNPGRFNRLSRGGDRQINAAIYTIALSRSVHHAQSRAYINRRIDEGKTKREAMRSLKRHLSRHPYNQLTKTPLTT
jgi:hypothetical protein